MFEELTCLKSQKSAKKAQTNYISEMNLMLKFMLIDQV